jgi:hypothetical protein
MTEYEKDLLYVKKQIDQAYNLDSIHQAQRLWKFFLDKWSIKLSPTDPTLMKTKSEVGKIVEEKYTRISKAYL